MFRFFLSISAVLLSAACYAQDILPAPSSKSPADKKFFYPFEISMKAGAARHSVPANGRGAFASTVLKDGSNYYVAQNPEMSLKVSGSASVYVSPSVDIGVYYDGGPVSFVANSWPNYVIRSVNFIPWMSRVGAFARYHLNIEAWDLNAFVGGGMASAKGATVMGGLGANYHIVGGLHASAQVYWSQDGAEIENRFKVIPSMSAVAGVSFRF